GREDAIARIGTGIGELDRVLGSSGEAARGLVPGSSILIGGTPGIGKSTLLLQAAASLAGRGTRVLYGSSEGSAQQVRARAERGARAPGPREPHAAEREDMGKGDRAGGPCRDSLFLLADTNLARIVEQARKVMPAVVIIDSIQMVYRSDLPAGPGSI